MREMFSGIVEEMGQVVSLTKNEAMELWDGSVGEGTELVIKADVALDGAYEGASICVNGVCTTVVTYDGSSFKVGLAPETLRRSDLGGLKTGDAVNLERALAADGTAIALSRFLCIEKICQNFRTGVLRDLGWDRNARTRICS